MQGLNGSNGGSPRGELDECAALRSAVRVAHAVDLFRPSSKSKHPVPGEAKTHEWHHRQTETVDSSSAGAKKKKDRRSDRQQERQQV